MIDVELMAVENDVAIQRVPRQPEADTTNVSNTVAVNSVLTQIV